MALFIDIRILKNNEEEIVELLKNADMKQLITEAVEIGAVPQDVKKSLDSMDESVPRPRVIRYLLMHVYRGIEENLRLYDHWLKYLHKHLSSTDVLEKIKSAQTFTLSPVSAHATSEIDRSKYEDLILERHIPQLTELLVECAHKWENISIALGLPERVRKDLRAKQDPDCIVCFNEVLTKWVLDGYKHAKAPTLSELENVLKSQTVSLGREAEKLRAVKVSIEEELPSSSKKPRIEPPPLEIIQQSYNTTVPEGKSTLLEVQATTSRDVEMLYKWVKDGHTVSKGCHNNILCIDEASVTSEGSYECIVNFSDGGLTSVSSNSIGLKVNLSPVREALVTRYLCEPEVPEDSWPPASNDTYISLALIKQGDIDKAGEYGRNTVQGNMDDILADKESIEYENTFTNLKSTTRLLIEGRPGSGKTTLVHKFSQDWARGNSQLSLNNIKCLFLVHLRGFFNDHSVVLRDIIQLYFQGSAIDSVTKQIEESNGEGVCFILDGLDEYHPKSMKDTFVYKLITKQVFCQAVVIIASRPAASHQFRRTASKQIEVIGFMKQQIFEYIEAYPFPDPGERENLHRYLEHHPNVHHMCYLPIHAAMVCYLFDVMGSTLPRTETEMYSAFTHLTLFRTIRRDKSSELEQIESVSDLSIQEQELFSKICELSYEKTLSSKQVMKRSEVKDFFADINCGRESMGLITVDRMSKMCGFENLYTFLHLTFQEYLAAYHLFKYSKNTLNEIKSHSKKKHMQVVWKFYCGLEEFITEDARFVELLQSASVNNDSLFGVQCAFESQKAVFCDCVVESGEHGTLSFSGHFLTPSDLTAIGYVMKTATCSVEKLVLDRCKLTREGVDALFREAGEDVLSVKTLCFHGRDSRIDQFELLNSCLEKMTSLETLDMSNTALGGKKNHCLTAGITLPNLHTLKTSMLKTKCFRHLKFNSLKLKQIFLDDILLQGTEGDFDITSISFFYKGAETHIDLIDQRIRVSDISSIAAGLKHSSSCVSLNLTRCCIGSDGAKALAEGLYHCNSLETLNLKSNNIGSDGAKALAESLCCCNSLQTLNLEKNSIGCNGAKALAECLQHCISLQTLNLGDNGIGASGTKDLTECFKYCNNLQRLDLWDNNIGTDGAKALAECFQHHSSLQVLNLWDNNIGDDGAKALAEGLRNCSTLQELKLWENSIGDDGAKALAENLQHCDSLQSLNLWGNNFSDDGARALNESLQHCNSLSF